MAASAINFVALMSLHLNNSASSPGPRGTLSSRTSVTMRDSKIVDCHECKGICCASKLMKLEGLGTSPRVLSSNSAYELPLGIVDDDVADAVGASCRETPSPPRGLRERSRKAAAEDSL